MEAVYSEEISQELRGYAICATPRSGSNFVGQMLASTGRLGTPLEYFNGPARRTLGLIDYPDEPERQIQAVMQIGATANGVYGLKLFPHQFRAVQPARWTEVLPNLSFVHLSRADVLGQALSWARAAQTEQYRSTAPALRTARYDGPLIRRALAAVVAEDARWRLWFARTGVRPVSLTYEEAAAHPQFVVDAVSSLIGLPEPPTVDCSKIDLRVQRDAETEEWRTRFVREYGDRADIEAEYGEFGISGRAVP